VTVELVIVVMIFVVVVVDIVVVAEVDTAYVHQDLALVALYPFFYYHLLY